MDKFTVVCVYYSCVPIYEMFILVSLCTNYVRIIMIDIGILFLIVSYYGHICLLDNRQIIIIRINTVSEHEVINFGTKYFNRLQSSLGSYRYI